MKRNEGKRERELQLGSERVLGLFVNKWSIKVTHSLARSKKRPGRLKRELWPVSQKVLTKTLRDLEKAGLVVRRKLSSKPLAVEYELSRLGKTFIRPLNALCSWAEAHKSQINQTVNFSANRR